MELGESMEDYLEAIYILSNMQEHVRSVDVATYLGFSKPSVSHAVKLLSEKGYLRFDPNKILYLTKEGEDLAKETYDRHCFFSHVLQEIGVPKEIAQKDACRIEHVLSRESYNAIQNWYKQRH
ncbi:metal-dependent transcriptional regulator [Catenisphaera adipataccumulans]|jgi:Mn-dependent DtxR family transcriptional regulator|uniref:Mn-dependent DtxR family transcriptional regulator n=1 Tax=Catenisphaera adipataccumulans TaxID=700500 RepID=A0A7W8CWG6_9FIRM|nr:metal-dependent transcriptional regulator [Catenisphaera adipataccumulans]MBB5182848.1 Mn-dependent DtxR family transcriptional regulator [Catenisphaera adipataccumulans]